MGSCVQETPLKASRKEDRDHHTCLWLAAIPLLLHPFTFFLCVMRGGRNGPQSTACQHVTSQGRRCWLHPGNPSEAPGPLVQLSSPGGSASEEQKTARLPPPSLPGQEALPLASDSGLLWEAAGGEGGRGKEAVQTEPEREVLEPRPPLPGLLLGPAHPYPSPGGLDQWEARPPFFP